MPDRMSSLRVVDPVLTKLAIGYKNAKFIADALFPIVTVPKEKTKIPRFGKEAFKLYHTKRAPRANSNRMLPESSDTVDLHTEENDLERPIDYREEQESMFNEEVRSVRVVKDAIELGREYAAAALAQSLSSFPANHKATLLTDDQWTNYTTSNPLDHNSVAKEQIRSKIGIDPNTLVLGVKAFKALQFHPVLLDKIKHVSVGQITIDMLKTLFEIEKIFVGKGVYSSDADVFGDIWDDVAIFAYVPDNPSSIEEPSFGYTARREGIYPYADTYTTNGGKIKMVRYTDNYAPVIVGAEAGYLLNDVCA